MKLKPGAVVDRFPIIRAMAEAEKVAVAHGRELVITSGTDGKHMKDSLHYKGLAFDMRLWWWNEDERNTILNELKEALGHHYDVVLEKTHFHIEHDPK